MFQYFSPNRFRLFGMRSGYNLKRPVLEIEDARARITGRSPSFCYDPSERGTRSHTWRSSRRGGLRRSFGAILNLGGCLGASWSACEVRSRRPRGPAALFVKSWGAKWCLKGILGGLGEFPGASWSHLGVSRGVWGRSWEVLGGLGAILGRHFEQSNFRLIC